MLAARNHTDAGLAQIVEATSVDDLLDRMRIAATEVRGAVDRRGRGGRAGGARRTSETRLADRLLALSDEIVGTVETLGAFPEQAAPTSA